MKRSKPAMIHALEFECQTPQKFYENCASCPRFTDDCPDLALGIEILRGKKKIIYNEELQDKDTVDARSFNCLAPLYYIEKTRQNCAHQGRCREEGLLIALLSGKKEMVYAQKKAVEFPRLERRHEKKDIREGEIQTMVVS
jgi:hypothetical protein